MQKKEGSKSEVALAKCNSYEYELVKKAVKNAIDLLGGIEAFVKPNMAVLIKPNLLIPVVPEKAATTHPHVVRAIVEIVSRITRNIWVGDCSMGDGATQEAFVVTGIADALKGTPAILRNFEEEGFSPFDIKGYVILERTDFAIPCIHADIIINVPKLKTHGITFFTGAVKNCFGCVHPEERKYLHQWTDRIEFSQGLVDVYSFLRPKIVLTVMDAIVGMEGDEGPSYGHPKPIGLICASSDCVALDAVASALVGYNPLAIPTTKVAAERRLGQSNLADINILGESLEAVTVSDFQKHRLFDFINTHKKNGFFIVENKKENCTACGACAAGCPVEAISMSPYPVIDQEKCIHCYCCHEGCPSNAMRLVKANK